MSRIEISESDITRLRVDAVVNAANEAMLGGGGVDGAIHRAAGPALLEECRRIPEVRPDVRCPTGEARITGGHGLAARFVIHAVGPVWRGGAHRESDLLASCYRESLRLAARHSLQTIAFPAISCGAYGYPIALAADVAVRTIRAFLAEDDTVERVVLAAFTPEVRAAIESAMAASAALRPPRHLETPRLRLRPPTTDDARFIFEDYAQDAEVTRYLTWAPHRDIEETRSFLAGCERSWFEGSAFPWVIERKEDERLLGMIDLRLSGPRADVGYVLARAHWGRGYMVEAVRTLVQWSMAQAGIHRLGALCDVENTASRRVLEKAGLTLEGTLRRWGYHSGAGRAPRDVLSFSIVRE
jgi:O-acetyl-ADP-ribose deacetylase (regulator of RNase III)/predicted acetyltransferase